MERNKELLMEHGMQIQHPDYTTEILAIMKGNLTPKMMQKRLLEYHENDIAAAMDFLKKEERQRIYSILDVECLAGILDYSEHFQEYMEELNIRKRVMILKYLEISTVVEYLRNLEKEERNTLIELMDEELQHKINLVNSFDEDEIGSIMSTNFIEIKTGTSIKEAMRELIEQAAENDNIQTIYVVDSNGLYYGAIDLKDLIRAREGNTIDSIVSTSYPYVYAHELIDDTMNKIKDYAEDSIPVLDQSNKLLGVITSQDMVEVIDDSMKDDYAKFASLGDVEDLNETVGQSLKKRLPWLTILLFLGMLVSTVVGLFDFVAQKLSILIAFQSLVLGMTGNSGTQSLAVTIRVLTDENLTTMDKLKLMWKETRIGFGNGAILGLTSFLVLGLYVYFFKDQSLLYSFSVSGCTAIALLVSMTMSTAMGTVIPIFFKKIGVDPAVASGPLITTVNDLVAVVTYYGLSYLLLIRLMGFGL